MAAAARKTMPEPVPEPVAPARRTQLHVTTSSRIFIVDTEGRLWERLRGQEQHLPETQRKPYWSRFPTPNGWDIDQIDSGPNGTLYCLAEGSLWSYTRDPTVTFAGLQNAHHWVRMALPDDTAPAAPEVPRPTLSHSAVGLPGTSATFQLDAGRYVLQADEGIVVLERSTGIGGYKPLALADRKFELPAMAFCRIYSPTLQSVDVFKFPEGN